MFHYFFIQRKRKSKIGSQSFLTEQRSHGIVVTFVDTSDLDAFKQALNANVKLVWIESPTNPLLTVTAIAAVCSATHAVNKQIIVCVDNTLASPYCQRPLSLGANLVSHSVTKYLNGHDDVTVKMNLNDKFESLKQTVLDGCDCNERFGVVLETETN